MTTYITEYFNNTELPKDFKNIKLIKFKGFKNNDKAEGPCIIGYIVDEYNHKYYYYEEVHFIDNNKIGPYKKYYENGDICEEGIYENNLKNGPYKIYNIYGKISKEGNYENDKKNGPYKIYWDGNLYEEGIYINDLKNGHYKLYWDGHMYEEGIYVNDFKSGPYKRC